MSREPARRPFQFSLWSLLVLTTLVAAGCSIFLTNWSVPLILALGIGICRVGFGKLSYQRHPEAGYIFIVVGFVARLTGLGIVAYGLLLWFGHAIRPR